MSKKYEIIPNIVITIDIHSFQNIPLVIRNLKRDIIYKDKIDIAFKEDYFIRKQLINKLYELIEKYNVNMIIIEQNKLFTNSFELSPDFRVLRNITRGFGIQTSIEDNFYDKVPYIMSLPDRDWQTLILNNKFKYSFDLYKSHIEKQEFTDQQLREFQLDNYYKVLCLSESMWFDKLMNKKYQINAQ